MLGGYLPRPGNGFIASRSRSTAQIVRPELFCRNSHFEFLPFGLSN
jgi:hypothetical protein